MSEWMNYAKGKIELGKQDAFVWYSVAARWFTMGSILLYVASCIVAGGLVGPVRYIEFLYHCCHFEQSTQVTVVAPKPDIGSARRENPKHPPVLNPNASF